MIVLNVPFLEKDEAKRLGARWNSAAKRWYIPEGVDHAPFARWLPEDHIFEIPTNFGPSNPDRTEYSLAAFLYKVSDVIQKNFAGAAWVSAEISELRTNKGHLFLTLVEHDEQGNMVARTDARIWQRQVTVITEKFMQGTGGANLEAGIKVLVLARVEFHPQYGLALFIDDIDPAYTLGDMAAKLEKIREVLTAEKIFDRNKTLPKPQDFTRIAVISPQNAAGLGDFNREAQILIAHGLCEFVYYTATFQGEPAPQDICKAIESAIAAHLIQPFDALVIIRGGGAISDLAWLNNEKLARAVCLCPIHVMAGIGHERDYTIIDEVAGERFDTPSKVIQRIFNLITNNAVEAETNYKEIFRKAEHYMQYTSYALDKLQQDIRLAITNILQLYSERCTALYAQIGAQAKQDCNLLLQQAQALMSEILTQSPQNVLRKGYALISDISGKVLTSKHQAQREHNLQITFHDGVVQATLKS